jgi:phenylalanyl-tRNA synthetase beta chain
MVPTFAFRRRVREALVRAGLREALSLSFASAADLGLMGHTEAIRVANPPAADDPFLRTSLVPNLLRALARNLDRGRRGAALFEVGHVFRPAGTGAPTERPVDEREAVAAALTGPAGEGLHADGREYDFLDAKGALEALLASVGARDWALGEPPGPPFHPARSATVLVDGSPAGAIGELHPGAAGSIGLTSRVAVFELDAAVLAAAGRGPRPFRDIPRFPPLRRDLAFVVDAATPAGAVRDAIVQAGGALTDRVILFDAFEGEPLPAGSKNVAFSIEFRAPDRTLTDEEADAAVRAIVERVKAEFGAEFRSG